MEQPFVSLVLRVGLQQQKGKDEEKGTGQRPWDQRGRRFVDRNLLSIVKNGSLLPNHGLGKVFLTASGFFYFNFVFTVQL